MKKIATIFALTILWSTILLGQAQHEFSIAAGGAITRLNYSSDAIFSSPKLGYLFGANYHFFFSDQWGLGTGVELSHYSAMLNTYAPFEAVEFGLDDGYGNIYDLHSEVSGYKEQQQLSYLNIPLQVIFQMGDLNRFFASVGVKIGLPVGDATYKLTQGKFVNSGYFPEYDNWAIDQTFMGFGTFSDRELSGTFERNIAYFLTAEIGLKWELLENMFLYTGLYFEHSVNNILKEADNPNFIARTNSDDGFDFTTRSALVSSFYKGDEQRPFTQGVRPMAFGIKLRFSIGAGYR